MAQNLKLRHPGRRMFTPFWRRHDSRPGTPSPDTRRWSLPPSPPMKPPPPPSAASRRWTPTRRRRLLQGYAARLHTITLPACGVAHLSGGTQPCNHELRDPVGSMSGGVQDFKEAARLSAEAKALASTAQASEEEAQALRAQAAAVQAEEHACLQGAKQKEVEAAEAERAAALAKWRLLKVATLLRMFQGRGGTPGALTESLPLHTYMHGIVNFIWHRSSC